MREETPNWIVPVLSNWLMHSHSSRVLPPFYVDKLLRLTLLYMLVEWALNKQRTNEIMRCIQIKARLDKSIKIPVFIRISTDIPLSHSLSFIVFIHSLVLLYSTENLEKYISTFRITLCNYQNRRLKEAYICVQQKNNKIVSMNLHRRILYV